MPCCPLLYLSAWESESHGNALEGIERAAGGVHQLGNGHDLGLSAAERTLVLADRWRVAALGARSLSGSPSCVLMSIGVTSSGFSD
jgi:hypothetical protein